MKNKFYNLPPTNDKKTTYRADWDNVFFRLPGQWDRGRSYGGTARNDNQRAKILFREWELVVKSLPENIFILLPLITMEKIKKIPFYQAENILQAEHKMFDNKTNRMFGTIATYLVVIDGIAKSIRVKNYRDGIENFHDYEIKNPQNAIGYMK